ncbi:MAG: dicarboxylate/amino acid:cation symporter [Anaerococcus obesiensis]
MVVSSLKTIVGDLIGYIVPLIILGFVTPAIVSLKENAGKILTVTLLICYLSSIGAGTFSFLAGKAIIPHLNIASNVAGAKEIPESIFKLSIDPIMPVMTALVTSIIFGIAVILTKSKTWENLLLELNNIVLKIVDVVVINMLPFYIASTFAVLSYEGVVLQELPVFLKIILIVIVGHFIWMTLLYSLGGLFSKTNPKEVFGHYLPAYLTALGTMSSAATLSVALKCARKSKTLDPKIRDFVIPLCANTHLCGSVLTEVFCYDSFTNFNRTSSIKCKYDCIYCITWNFAIAAPGVPGGTVVTSLGLIISVLGFNDTGTALMLSIFALQDSFGTACNVTGDGAIALMVTGIFDRVPKDPKEIEE